MSSHITDEMNKVIWHCEHLEESGYHILKEVAEKSGVWTDAMRLDKKLLCSSLVEYYNLPKIDIKEDIY